MTGEIDHVRRWLESIARGARIGDPIHRSLRAHYARGVRWLRTARNGRVRAVRARAAARPRLSRRRRDRAGGLALGNANSLARGARMHRRADPPITRRHERARELE